MLRSLYSFPRAVLAAMVSVALALTAAVATPSQAQPRLFVDQGSVVLSSLGTCTVGLVDSSKRVAYVSAHCGSRAGEDMKLMSGETVVGHLGKFYPSTVFDNTSMANDWATIKLDPAVRIGNNKFTGTRAIRPENITKQDRVCFHGQTTHGDTDAWSCNTYAGRVGNTIFFGGGSLGQQGDSGGPVWVERDGQRWFAGIHSGKETYSDPSKNQWIGRAAYPEDGHAGNFMDRHRIFAEFFGLPQVGGLPIFEFPGAEASSQSSDGNLSPEAIGGIISVILTILAFLGINAANFLR